MRSTVNKKLIVEVGKMRHGGDRVFKMRELPKDYSDKIERNVDEPDVIEGGAYRRDEA